MFNICDEQPKGEQMRERKFRGEDAERKHFSFKYIAWLVAMVFLITSVVVCQANFL